ncbi:MULTISPECIES: hypothetical protein [unclassified Microbacterium]|uniref:hypothetical protein n=1 Tax=unclassified Microbacterium TaxID=2609290 RepID=UPI00301A6032
MSEQQPELRWAPMEPKPKRTGRVWLIIGLVVAALAVIGALLFFLLPRSDAPETGANGTPSPSTSASPAPTTTPDLPSTPATTPPAPADPTLDAFRAQVGGWLTDAPRGLDLIASVGSDDALQVVDTLEQDARRLSDAQPPASIDTKWREGVDAYAQRLTELRSAILAETKTAGAVDAARSAVQSLQGIVGL